jgi:hypothetical protein
MSLRIIPIILIAAFLVSCNHSKPARPETALDTGREFIRASLNGDFKNAETLLSKDEENRQLFESFKKYYDRMPADKKQHYKSASYEINKYVDLDDSTVIINYSNDYMNKPMDIKVIRKNNEWNVDFKYTYSGNLPID